MVTAEALGLVPFYARLDTSGQQALLNAAYMAHFTKGQMLAPGSCLGLAFIVTGRLRVFMASPLGRELTLFTVEKGQACAFTSPCLIKGFQVAAGLQFTAESNLLIVPPAPLLRLQEQNPAVAGYLSELLAAGLNKVSAALEQALFTPLLARLAALLVEKNKKVSEQGGLIRISHAEIAAELGSAREAVSRLMKYLQTQGLLTQHRGRVEIKNPEKLSLLM